MGQKVHPNAFRLGVYKPWQARWYGDKDYTEMLLEDMKMRRLILERLRNAGISKVETERSANQATVIIWTAKPGIVIGKGGASVDQLRDDLEKMTGKKVRVTIQEIKHPELDAMLVAQNVAAQLERRIAFRRAVKQSVLRTMRAGAKGVKIAVSGRLGGAEMSRREWDRDGRVPLHTLKANIDFGQTEARTTFGRIGVSVWVYLGDFDLTTREETFDEIPCPSAPGRFAADRADRWCASGCHRRPGSRRRRIAVTPAGVPAATAGPTGRSLKLQPRASAPEAPALAPTPEAPAAETAAVEEAPCQAGTGPQAGPQRRRCQSAGKGAAETKAPPRKRASYPERWDHRRHDSPVPEAAAPGLRRRPSRRRVPPPVAPRPPRPPGDTGDARPEDEA